MAAITLPSAIRATSTTKTRVVQYGATVSLGNPLYLDTTDNKSKLADANASATTANAYCIALTPGIDGSYGLVAIGGSVELIGSTLAVGVYVLGSTAGSIVPEADLTTGDYLTQIGLATSTTSLLLDFQVTGVTHA
jgi:hypothetical protein